MVGNTVLRNLTGCPIFDDGENLFLGAIGPRERGKAVVSDIEGHLGESLLGVPFLAIFSSLVIYLANLAALS
jgi:hypothetical protein